jgi:O-antigen/teichoic acid export membrane protein
MAEAKYTFYLLAFSIPVVLVSGSFRGVVEAAQRFDLVNAVMIPFSILTFILPLVGLHLGLDVPGIVALIVLARFATLIAFIAMVFHIVPHLRDYSSSFEAFSSLFAFSIWATITSVVVPILVYLDRFLISSLLTIAALAYYTVPYEVATRIWIITTSLTMTLFPAFSSLEGVGDGQKIGTLFARSLKYVLIATGPIISLIVVHARSILQIWLGNDFAIEGTIVMQVIGLGVLINSLGHTPFAFLQGIGRPDLPAKFHIIELPIYIVLVWILLSEFGIVGAACAWTLRVLLDTFLLFFAAFKIYPLKPGLLGENGTTPAIILLLAFASILYTLKWVTSSYPLIAQSLLSIGLLALFACAAWYYVLDDTDRRVINKAVNPKKIKEYNI